MLYIECYCKCYISKVKGASARMSMIYMSARKATSNHCGWYWRPHTVLEEENPSRWVDEPLEALPTQHSSTLREGPILHVGWVPPGGGQGSISLGYKTSANLFDFLVTGMSVSTES